MDKSKKTFGSSIQSGLDDAAARLFISSSAPTPSPIRSTDEAQKIPVKPIQKDKPATRKPSSKQTPASEEIKSRRVQLVLTPSLYEAIKAQAAAERRSFNDYVSIVLEESLNHK